MRLLGLTGFPLGHSFSPAYFRSKFEQLGLHEWDYRLFPLENSSDIRPLFEREPNLVALNVTIPHKKAACMLADKQSEEARTIGAANLLIANRDKGGLEIAAFNTDAGAFEQSLDNWYLHTGKKALIFGSGGSSKAVACVLKRKGIAFDICGRTSELRYDILNLTYYGLIVNCTPVGMSGGPAEGALPLPYGQAGPDHFFFDLVYNPLDTPSMKCFRDQGASVKNGLEMLHFQADRTWELVSSINI